MPASQSSPVIQVTHCPLSKPVIINHYSSENVPYLLITLYVQNHAERFGEASENILYIGDRIDMDIKPALQIGMLPVLKAAYTNAGKTPPNGAFKVTHLSELPALIQKLNAAVNPS